MRGVLLRLLAGAACVAIGAAAPTVELATKHDAAARLTVPVMVNGQGPFPFVVDTGADRTVISRELAISLALQPASAVVINDIARQSEASTVSIDRLSIGRREVTGIRAPVLDAASLGAAGMLGTDAVRGQTVVMDFDAHALRIAPSAEDGIWMDDVVVYGVRHYGALVLVDAESHSRPIFVILDTGAQDTLGNEALRRLLAGDRDKGKPELIDVISVTGSKAAARPSTIDQIKLGGVTLGNVPVAYAALHTFEEFHLQDRPAMLLGMDILRLFRKVSVDFRHGKVVFIPR